MYKYTMAYQFILDIKFYLQTTSQASITYVHE